MKVYYLSRSTRKGKKFMIKSVGGKTIHFGQFGASDYTRNKDPLRQQMYIIRHSKENWNDLSTAGAWSYNLLWSKPSIVEAIRSMEKRYGIQIVF